MVMLTTQEQAEVETYNHYTAAQEAEQNRVEPVESPLRDHLNAMIRFHQEEIRFQGDEIGALARVKTAFRKSRTISALCDMHTRIADDMMQVALEAIDGLRAELRRAR